MALSRQNDYAMYLYTCNRCRGCAVEPSPEHRQVCPAYGCFGFFTYTGGGKGYVAQGILEGKVPPSIEAQQVAMNCLMCGACAAACPPGFDINNFVRDLRDHLVQRGFFANDAHRRILEDLHRAGNPWGQHLLGGPWRFWTGVEDLLVWTGCHERRSPRLLQSLTKVLDAAGMSWGVLVDEPCCGAPLLDLGDRAGFARRMEKALAAIEAAGAERVLVLCPHCAAAFLADGVEVGDLAGEALTVPALLAELVSDGLVLADAPAERVTYHDPCRLARWLEETEPPRQVLAALPGVELIEMPRSGQWTYCCGAGGHAAEVAPRLAEYALAERLAEARATEASCIVASCDYCVNHLSRRAAKRPRVIHLLDLVAERIGDE